MTELTVMLAVPLPADPAFIAELVAVASNHHDTNGLLVDVADDGATLLIGAPPEPDAGELLAEAPEPPPPARPAPPAEAEISAAMATPSQALADMTDKQRDILNWVHDRDGIVVDPTGHLGPKLIEAVGGGTYATSVLKHLEARRLVDTARGSPKRLQGIRLTVDGWALFGDTPDELPSFAAAIQAARDDQR